MAPTITLLRWSMVMFLPTVVLAFVPPSSLDRSRNRVSLSAAPTKFGLFSFDRPSDKRSRGVDSSSTASSSSSSSSSLPVKFTKLQKLKDKMWIRETKEDLTAAEFACSLDASQGEQQRKRKRAVDYDNLLAKLEQSVLDLCCDDKHECQVTLDSDDNLVPSANGKGSIFYTLEQREALLKKILQTRRTLMETMKGHAVELEDDSPFNIQLPEMPEILVDIPKENPDGSTESDSLLYVRDDGTVDWDGALQDRAALKKFGTAVWARINGQDPDEVDEDRVGEKQKAFGEKSVVTAKIVETEAIRLEKKKLDDLMKEYNEMESEHTALLNSAISAGQAVANINLATLDPKLRNLIKKSTESLEKMKEEVSFQTLMYELERIYTYLDGEMSSKGYIPLQDRLNVAEFGLFESQVESLKNQMEAGEIVDPDVLAVLLDQLTDFKRRLGIDFRITGLTFDRQAIVQWLSELAAKSRDGLAFYAKGCRLFWNDLVFGLSLVGRALRGYTLKPREVRNLRRTVKDIVTFVPVIIILLIPLSPVGHVLVFGAIQRFFPGFFPSCFTESRQNLLQLYESAEYSELTINESWKEKLSRISEALLFLIANSVRALYTKLRGVPPDTKKSDVSSPEEGL